MTPTTSLDLRVLTPETASKLLHAIVDAAPADYVNPKLPAPSEYDAFTCKYARYEGDTAVEPSCIIGQLGFRLGIPLKNFRDLEGSPVADFLGHSYRMMPYLEVALQFLQQEQDAGKTWQEALKNFDIRLPALITLDKNSARNNG